jgi:PhnB protein
MKVITPYLNFDGNCGDAMKFYQECIGGDLYTMTFGEAKCGAPPEADSLLAHARLKKGDTMIMASDTMPGMTLTQGNNVWLSLECDSDEELESVYKAFSAGGKGTLAPNNAFWGAYFAMLTDRFGMNWMLNHERVKQG